MKYKCLNCGKQFQHSGIGDITCPNCGSYNVSVQRSTSSALVGVLVAFAIIIVGVLAYLLFFSKPSQGSSKKNKGAGEPTELYFVDGKVVAQPTLNPDNNLYSFAVTAELNEDSSKPIEYTLDTGGMQQTNRTGEFEDVKAPTNGNSYTVIASLSKSPDVEPFEIIVKFKNVKPVTAEAEDEPVVDLTPQETADAPKPAVKVSISEVQGWMDQLKSGNTDNPLIYPKKNPKIAPNYTISLTGLHPEDASLSAPHASKISEKFMMDEWREVRITSINCDDNGKVNKIIGEVVY